jgi:hypothetical protein
MIEKIARYFDPEITGSRKIIGTRILLEDLANDED